MKLFEVDANKIFDIIRFERSSMLYYTQKSTTTGKLIAISQNIGDGIGSFPHPQLDPPKDGRPPPVAHLLH